jgi:hypothetical protein
MGHPEEDIPDGDHQADARLTAEVPEVLAVALLGSLGLLVLSSVGAALVSAFIGPPLEGSAPAAQILNAATEWASPLAALLIFAALGATWWQLDGWSDVVDEFSADPPASPTEEELRLAVRYLRRGRALASACMAMLGLLAAGQIGLSVSAFVIFGSDGFGDTGSGQNVRAIGSLLATGLLVVAGLWFAIRERSNAAVACSSAEGYGSQGHSRGTL